MINPWDFPKSLNIGGKDYEIRTDYRVIIDLLIALSDPELDFADEREKAYAQARCILEIMFPDCDNMPQEDIEEALQKASEFIDMGIGDEGKRPKTMDWQQDAPVIIPAINKVLGKEVRSVDYMHWWTFLGAYMEIGESLFTNIVHIRQKKAKHKKLETWELEFYRNNKKLIDLQTAHTQAEIDEMEYMASLLD